MAFNVPNTARAFYAKRRVLPKRAGGSLADTRRDESDHVRRSQTENIIRRACRRAPPSRVFLSFSSERVQSEDNRA